MKIAEAVLAGARRPPASLRNPFELSACPPGVIPKDAPKLAQDEAITSVLTWAANAYGSAIAEGVTFLGWPELSVLAQRPEYRRISETIARHMTRKWIKFRVKGDGDKTEKIAKLEDAMTQMNVKETFRRLAEQDGFFGRAHLYLDLGTSDDRDELKTPIGDGQNAISRAKVTKGGLKRLKTIEATWVTANNYNANDPLRPDWYRPTQWYVMGKQLHASRLLTFIGREVPDLLKPVYQFGGLSLSQMAKPYVDNWLRTRQSVADIISAFSVFVLSTNMTEQLNGGLNGDALFQRAQLFNDLRDNRGLMMMDKATEDFRNVSAPLSGLDSLQAQTQEHMAAVSGIPIVELLGIQPAGLNATSEGEVRTFFDWIHANQENFIRPGLTRVIGFVQLSEFGEVDPDITFDFEPLWSLDGKELAEKQLTEAQTDETLIETGAITPTDVRKRLIADPSGPYTGLELDDLPLPDFAGYGEGEEPDNAGDPLGEREEKSSASLKPRPPRQMTAAA